MAESRLSHIAVPGIPARVNTVQRLKPVEYIAKRHFASDSLPK